ncbi:MAG: DNA repair protein RecN [Chloroflexota bacterium]|nr:DNA repair protein RecN [Chloroflexota bacterium]
MALIELAVSNLAVIESARLQLGRGLVVVTGETGAGKSLVVDALALALGARAASDLVRSGSPSLRVEAIFDDAPRDPDDPLDELVDLGEGQLIVSREVFADGRSVARVNDRTVTVSALAAFGRRLAEIHGQHEHQRLFATERQLALLDRFGGNDALLAAVSEAWRSWRSLVAHAAELVTDPAELERRVELLRHEVAEISDAHLVAGEDEVLIGRVRAAQNLETVARSVAEAVRILQREGGALDAIRAALTQLEGAAEHDERFAELATRGQGIVAEGTELARDAAALGEQLEMDPATRAHIEERLGLMYDLKRKYGESIEAILVAGREAASELARLEDQEALREGLRRDEARARALLDETSATLGAARRRAAVRLTELVNAELPPLGLPAGAFGIEIMPTEVGPNGGDWVEFRFAPNPGEPPRPLARIASGGEASRLSLALKVVLATADETPVLIFDEVDAGVGGRNAGSLGERLRALSEYHQVLCVTHLPQVAAFADMHLHVGKRVDGGRTYTEARVLSVEERATELAAMLAGEGAGGEAQAAAEALLRAAAMSGPQER